MLRDSGSDEPVRVDLTDLLSNPGPRAYKSSPQAQAAPKREVADGEAPSVATPSGEAPSVDSLLDEAGRLQRQQRWDAAVDVLREMMRLYPDEKASLHAEVALGHLLQDKLHQSTQALEHFDRYLHRGDAALAEEALFGKARALRSLGRKAEEKEALCEYVDRFPHAMNIEDVRARLAEGRIDTTLKLDD